MPPALAGLSPSGATPSSGAGQDASQQLMTPAIHDPPPIALLTLPATSPRQVAGRRLSPRS